jgi:thiol-disulfide isomerase/thioredoxin
VSRTTVTRSGRLRDPALRRARALGRAAVCALLLTGLGLGACDEAKGGAAAPPSRVVAIASKSSDSDPSELCDVTPAAGGAPTFAFPPVEGHVPEPIGAPRWVNVWATWCPPCIEELPLLRKLERELKQGGTAVSLVLLSVDTDSSAVQTFEAKHPEVAGSLRLTDVAQLEPWLASVGLDKGATLPVHVFVDAHGKVLCSRTGAIQQSDAARLKKLFGPK